MLKMYATVLKVFFILFYVTMKLALLLLAILALARADPVWYGTCDGSFSRHECKTAALACGWCAESETCVDWDVCKNEPDSIFGKDKCAESWEVFANGHKCENKSPWWYIFFIPLGMVGFVATLCLISLVIFGIIRLVQRCDSSSYTQIN